MNWDGIFAGTGWMQPRWKERTCLAESINLAEMEQFELLYLKYMNLGEN